MASKKLIDMEKLWKATNNKMKLRIIRTCIFPIAIHGCESWILNKNITKPKNAVENKCYWENSTRIMD